MKSFNKQVGLNRFANKLVGRLDQFEKLKEIANRKNYPHKVSKLHARILEEYSFWDKKEDSSKLSDLKKDLKFIQTQLDVSDYNKERIDLLMEKYGYGKSS